MSQQCGCHGSDNYQAKHKFTYQNDVNQLAIMHSRILSIMSQVTEHPKRIGTIYSDENGSKWRVIALSMPKFWLFAVTVHQVVNMSGPPMQLVVGMS